MLPSLFSVYAHEVGLSLKYSKIQDAIGNMTRKPGLRIQVQGRDANLGQVNGTTIQEEELSVTRGSTHACSSFANIPEQLDPLKSDE